MRTVITEPSATEYRPVLARVAERNSLHRRHLMQSRSALAIFQEPNLPAGRADQTAVDAAAISQEQYVSR
jgi:hypothetical protein